jgi:hypothetical protein
VSRLAVDNPEQLDAEGAPGRTGPSRRRRADLDPRRLVAVALVVGAVGFTATGVARLVQQRDIDVVTLPLALLAADLLIAAALVTRWYPIRPVAQGLAIFGALVHALVLLRSGPWWVRGWSGLLAAAHVSALVLFFSLTAREYDDGDDTDAAAGSRPDTEPCDAARPEVVNRPISAEVQPEVGARRDLPQPADPTGPDLVDRGDQPEPAGASAAPVPPGREQPPELAPRNAQPAIDGPTPEPASAAENFAGPEPVGESRVEPGLIAGSVAAPEPVAENPAEPEPDAARTQHPVEPEPIVTESLAEPPEPPEPPESPQSPESPEGVERAEGAEPAEGAKRGPDGAHEVTGDEARAEGTDPGAARTATDRAAPT